MPEYEPDVVLPTLREFALTSTTLKSFANKRFITFSF